MGPSCEILCSAIDLPEEDVEFHRAAEDDACQLAAISKSEGFDDGIRIPSAEADTFEIELVSGMLSGRGKQKRRAIL